MKEKKNGNYKQDLMKRLQNAEFAETYLNAAFEDEDKHVFLLALRDVTEARGGMGRIARLTDISREHIYRMLSEKGNPELETLKKLLSALNLKISISTKDQDRKAA
ncbi:MAG: putative addiction module antidote protein [Candidatus Omnitrophica bacterium]|nr:putative addiction module antidote protein [Candidatus Omnitrophota bacterium]